MPPLRSWRQLLLRLHRQQSRHDSAAALYPPRDQYAAWRTTNRLTPRIRSLMEFRAADLARDGVTISLVLPLHDVAQHPLRELIESIRAQIYQGWELCIGTPAACASTLSTILPTPEPRIKVAFQPESSDAAAVATAALQIATGDYLAFVDQNALLSPDALLHVVECVTTHPETDWVYTDEDEIDAQGHHTNPQFKPEFSPELAMTHRFAQRLACLRRTLVEDVGFGDGPAGASQFDLFLRVAERTPADRVRHVPYPCYHARPWLPPASPTDLVAGEVAAIEQALRRRGLAATVTSGWADEPSSSAVHQLRWQSLLNEMAVTIVIPIHDQVALLRACIESLRRTVPAQHLNVLVVDDNSAEPATLAYLSEIVATDEFSCRVLKFERRQVGFNYSAIMNAAATLVNTPLVLHLNNDVVAREEGWLENLVGWMAIPEVGVVGAKLLYPNGTIQHAGLAVGLYGGLPEHLFKHLPDNQPGYLGLANATRNVSAVTGACLLTRTALYRELGGFDEEHYPVAYNDVDYCLRVWQHGMRVVYAANAVLTHHEHGTRGPTWHPDEHVRFLDRHAGFVDPFVSRNVARDSLRMELDPLQFIHSGRLTVPPRILCITPSLEAGGSTLSLLKRLGRFLSEGCAVELAAVRDGPLRAACETMGVRVHIVDEVVPHGRETLASYQTRLAQLGPVLQLANIDVIVCNTLGAYWAVELARLNGLPTLWYIDEPGARLADLGRRASAKSVQVLLGRSFNTADRIVFPADAVRFDYEHLNSGRFRVLPTSVNVAAIDAFKTASPKHTLRGKHGIAPDAVVILGAGTMVGAQESSVLLEAVASVSARHPHVSLHCVVLGPDEPYDFFGLADIFVYTGSETFPGALLTAMAFELPVVANLVFGIPEMMPGEPEGSLVRPGDVRGFTRGIERYLTDPGAAQYAARAGYARARRFFDDRLILDKHLALLREVVLTHSCPG